MSLYAPDPIFKGITTSGALRAFSGYLSNKPQSEKYIVPCSGQMTVAEAIAGVGVPPARIETSDITLYSSALGYLCDPEKAVADLGFSVVHDRLVQLAALLPNTSEVERAALILYAIKWGQLQGEKDYVRWQRTEFEDSVETVFAQYVAALTKMVERIGGLSYEIMDFFEHVEPHIDDENALLFLDPPGFKGGYTKMFTAADLYAWDSPEIPELDPKKAGQFMGSLKDRAADIVVFGSEGKAISALPSEGWHKVYTDINPKTGKRTYVTVNRAQGTDAFLNRRRFMKPPTKVPPVFDDHEITEESTVAFVKTDAPTALYFYDLFVRELGMVKAEVYYLFCVDGQVAGTCGFDIRTHIIKRLPVLYETFGLSMTSQRYSRIGRLLMKSLCCQEFMDQFTAENVNPSLLLPALSFVQTTCLAKYPEMKKNRGILKLIGRTQLPNGRFHLVYKTAVHQLSFRDVLQEWMKKHSQHDRGE